MPTLLALFGSKQGLCLPLVGSCLVGRTSAADIQLLDVKASREHCRFFVHEPAEGAPGHVSVEDLGSHNGTFVNGERITAPTALVSGDEVAVGDSLFVLDGSLEVLAAKYGETSLWLAPSAGETIRAEGGKVEAPPADEAAEAAGREADFAGFCKLLPALARELAAAPTPETAAQVLLATLTGAFVPDRAFVLATDNAGGVRPLCGKSQGAAVAVSRTVLERARRDRRAVLVDDAVEDRELQKARSVLRHGLRSVMVAPVVAGTEVRGFLHVDRAGAGAFEAGDLARLEAVAAVAGLVGLERRAVTGPGPGTATVTGPVTATENLVGDSAGFRQALKLMDAAAKVDSAVLITGESGTGKEELARALHGRSRRGGGPFVAVNCGAIPESLAESALFGHQKGAFTGAVATHEGYFEAAEGGTLFLDEVGELPPALQVKLLRTLQEKLFFRLGSTTPRRADVRVVSATHRDLPRDVTAGRFREDLYFRLAVLPIHLPPLRERPGDLPALAQALLARVAARFNRPPPPLSASATQALGRWHWPGNARELSNVLERLLVLRDPEDTAAVDGDEVNAALGRDLSAPAPAPEAGDTLADKIAALERREIEAALRRARGVKSHAARALGLSRPTLDKKIADLNIDLWRE